MVALGATSTPQRPFAPLRRHASCLHGLRSADWRASTVLVVAVYREWTDNAACSSGRSCLPESPPAWLTAQHPTFVYQRLQARSPCYTPNAAFESGVYLQFIVDHYRVGLPAQMVFLQADWFDTARQWHKPPREPFRLWQPECSRPGWQDWMPLGKKFWFWPPYRVTRSAEWYRHHRAVLNDKTPLLIDLCWRELLGLFGRHAKPQTVVTFYPAMNFVVARRRVEQYRFAAWHGALRRFLENGTCLSGPAVVEGQSVVDDRGYQKVTIAEGMEALAHVIFGNQDPSADLDALPSLPAVNCSRDAPPVHLTGCRGGASPCAVANCTCCFPYDSQSASCRGSLARAIRSPRAP